MITSKLEWTDLEEAYDLIAAGIDRAGAAKAQLFLAKLALALASQLDGLEELRAAIEASLRDLHDETGPGHA
jgi:hypothetical protein